MIALLAGTTSVFLTHCLLALAFAGLGLLLRRAFGLRHATLDDCFLAFWMGFALAITFLMLWHFALPVGSAPLAIVGASGIAGLVMVRSDVTEAIRGSILPRRALVLTALFGLWVANLSLGRLTNWDSALYHIQGVQWIKAYPTLPGLANVFGPLGFNNSSFLYDAMLDVGPWSGRAWHVANGLLIVAFGAQALLSAAQLLRSRTSASPAHLFGLLLLAPAVDYAVTESLSSFATAVPASLLLMVAATRCYLATTAHDRPSQQRAYDFVCVVALSAAAVSVKSSAGVFAAAILVVSVFGVLRLAGAELTLRRRSLIWMATAVAVIGVAWTTRGVLLSGYPLFPSQTLGLSVDWRVPAEHARAELEFVEHSARATAENFAYVSGSITGPTVWLRHWARTSLYDLYDLAAPLGLATVIGAILWRLRRRNGGPLRGGWELLLPLVISIGAWFLIAPMPRYGTAFLWSLAALWGSQVFRLVRWTEGGIRRLVLGACLMGFTPCVVNPLWARLESGRSTPRASIVNTNFKLPTPGHWYQIDELEPLLTTYTTKTGVVLNVPIGRFGKCWDAPVPCTPNPAPNLRLRVPGRVDKGFTVDGVWQMQDWPEPWRPELLPAMREGWRRR